MRDLQKMEEKQAKMREYKRNYMREWRKRNPDKVAATAARYWAKRVEAAKAAEEGGSDSV